MTVQPRQIAFPDEEIDAVGSFLEFLYTGDYFPKKLTGQRTLEKDPSLPDVDESGDQLLKHARVYTLAEKWGVEKLKNIASGKIHCVNSTAKGEITYARYIYKHTTSEDSTVRAPIANFWATRSHTLRSEAEEEFRGLCLDIPQFGYDVLSKYLPLAGLACAHADLFISSRSGRETEEGAQRENAPRARKRAQEISAQRHLRRYSRQSRYHIIFLLWAMGRFGNPAGKARRVRWQLTGSRIPRDLRKDNLSDHPYVEVRLYGMY